MANPLEKLTLDHWYKVLMAAGFAVFLLSGAGLLPGLPGNPTLLISLGAFFFGLGEWRNHPLQTRLGIGYQITGYPRDTCLIGMLFDILGMLLVCAGIWSMLR